MRLLSKLVLVILKVCVGLYTVESPDMEIAEINQPKPNSIPGSLPINTNNGDPNSFTFPAPMDFGPVIGPGTLIRISQTPDMVTIKPGPSRKPMKM
jgi:hypothetical protein